MLLIPALLIPYSFIYGMDGMGEMIQLVKPMSMLPYTIGRMLMICVGIFFLAAVMFASPRCWSDGICTEDSGSGSDRPS